MELFYRAATSADIPGLCKLAIISYGQFRNVLSEDNFINLNTYISNERSYIDLLNIAKCFVCEKDCEIIGMAYIVPHGNPTDIFQLDWSYIRMVGVHPDYSGRGIARTLTQFCIDYAMLTGEKVIALHTAEFMNAARFMYEKIGFIRASEIEPRFGKKYWLYKFEL